MKWIAGIVLLASCVICAMLGLTAGINMNPRSSVAYVWDWGVAGGWVSGLGALLAVGFALLQSHKQQEKERAKCRILLEHGEWYLKVQIVSDGIIPSTVLSASISFDDNTRTYDLSYFQRLGFSFPKKLDRGDVSTLIDVERDEYRRLAFELANLLIAELAKRNVILRSYSPQVAEEYFSELKLCGDRSACLLLKTAHADLSHPLPPDFMRTCFSLVEAEHREWLQKDRESLRKEFQGYLEDSNPTDGEPPVS